MWLILWMQRCSHLKKVSKRRRSQNWFIRRIKPVPNGANNSLCLKCFTKLYLLLNLLFMITQSMMERKLHTIRPHLWIQLEKINSVTCWLVKLNQRKRWKTSKIGLLCLIREIRWKVIYLCNCNQELLGILVWANMNVNVNHWHSI